MIGKSIQIREATLKDLPTLLQFEQGIIQAERPFDPTIRPDPVNYYDLEVLLSSEESLVVVAETESQLVASGYVRIKKARSYLDHEDYAYLGFMYTHPDYRGQGINAAVIDRLRAWALKKGLKEIRLTVYDENVVALKAYEKYGFKKHIIEMRLPGQTNDVP